MKHIAFLRALNVGGRVIKMHELAAHFEAAGLTSVETFLASGNVLFEAEEDQVEALHDKLEAEFKASFGFESSVFIRSGAQICAIAAMRPFPEELTTAALTNCVGFTRAALPPSSSQTLQSIASAADRFHVEGSEIYWLSSKSQAEPSFTLKQLEKALGVSATFRGVNTVVRLAMKCGS